MAKKGEEEMKKEATATPTSSKKPAGPPGGMFVDADAMKARLRENMAKPDYDVMNFYKETGCWQKIGRHTLFDRLTMTVISFNAIYIWLDADYNTADDGTVPLPFQVGDQFFCIYFTLELIIRWNCFKVKRDAFRDNWFNFDTGMVVMMVSETWVLGLVLLALGGGSAGIDSSLLTILRLARLTRLARMAKLLRAMPELMILLKGMWAATRSVFFTLLLLFSIVYIFAIGLRMTTKDTDVGKEYFPTVPVAMHTLILRLTLMDNLGQLVMDVAEQSIALAVIVYTFLLISALTVMNMLIGVLCEVVSAVAATEKEESSVAYVKGKIQDIMTNSGIDEDGDGTVSKNEFVKILANVEACRILQQSGVDVFGLVDCADYIFEDDDDHADGEGKTLDFTDFMEVVLQLRGTNVATVKDIMDLRKYMSIVNKKTLDILQDLKANGSPSSGTDDKHQKNISPIAPPAGQKTPMQAVRATIGHDVASPKFSFECLRVELDSIRQRIDSELLGITNVIRRNALLAPLFDDEGARRAVVREFDEPLWNGQFDDATPNGLVVRGDSPTTYWLPTISDREKEPVDGLMTPRLMRPPQQGLAIGPGEEMIRNFPL